MMNKTGTQRLETHRLILRRCCAEDAEEMTDVSGMEAAVRYLQAETLLPARRALLRNS